MSGVDQNARPSVTQWRHTGDAWRLARRVTRRRLDLYLRARSAASLPGARDRFVAMGIPEDAVHQALRLVRSVATWPDAWTWNAQRFLGEARHYTNANDLVTAAEARRRAALSYHAAQLLVFDDDKKSRALRSSAVTLFSQSVALVYSGAVRVDLAWRTTRLPAYLVRPATLAASAPLVVFLNGSSTTKEELLAWSARFLQHGLAVLVLDWPGTGEASHLSGAGTDVDDMTEGIMVVAREFGLDERRIGLVGFSLGGAVAVRTAAMDRRIAACVAVTPPFDPSPWLPRINRMLFDHLVAAAGGADDFSTLAARFSVAGVVARLRCPLLVLGAGRDLVVPPGEAIRLCRAAGDLGTLLWFADGAHGLYDRVESWTDDVAQWLVAIFGDYQPRAVSTPVDNLAGAPTLRTR